MYNTYVPESSTSTSSIALLALKRFWRRTLRQMGIGAITLLFIVGITAHSPEAQSSIQPSSSLLNSGQRDRPQIVSMSLISPHPSSKQSKFEQIESVPKTEDAVDLVDRKPFQTVRPKMTYHRLTTSRFSIPTKPHQTVARLSAHE